MRTTRSWANRHAAKILLLGLAGVAWHNWRQWQRDRDLLDRRPSPSPPPNPESWPEQPLVSVLVAAWNEADMIEAHVRSFLALRYPHKELILCAGGDDGTYELARRHAGPGVVVLEQQPGEGKQRALRRCFERSQGEIIFLTDADCLLDDPVFLSTILPLVFGKETVVTGAHRPLDAQLNRALAQYQWFVNRYVAVRAPIYVPGLVGANCAASRQALVSVGDFQSQARVGTDYHLGRKLLAAGHRIYYQRESEVQTEYPVTPKAYRHEHSRWIRNVVLHGLRSRDYGQVVAGLRTMAVGWIMVGLLLLSPILGPITLVFGLLLLVHGWLARVRYMAFGQIVTHSTFGTLHYLQLALFMMLDFMTWASALVDLLLPARRHRW